jgi:diguanylate cyclase (GGDEF)-like protein
MYATKHENLRSFYTDMVMESVQDTLVGNVLIADDDAEFRNLLVRRANRMGLQVVEAEDGQQAIDILMQQQFNVLVVDLYMPGFTGIDVTRQAKEYNPDIQAIVLTASASLESALEALRAGVYDYLLKPLESLAEFELTLTRALEHNYLIRENKRLFAEVQRLAITDPLTGLYNRHKLEEILDSEFERAKRYDRPLCLIMADMDRLKEINDSHGHFVGDEALKLVADAITTQSRKVDIATRFGGDEFVVILPEINMQEAYRFAQRILNAVQTIENLPSPLSLSIGITELNQNIGSVYEFLRAADQALYQAKSAGGNKIAWIPLVEMDEL